ncbi:DUF6240 domain-containing protein [Agathobacter sp.]
MQIENLINNNIDSRNGNAVSDGMRAADYMKDGSIQGADRSNGAVVSSANSVDMSDTIYAKPQNKKDDDKKSVVDSLGEDSSMTSENRRNEMVVVANTTTTDDYKAAKDDGYNVIVTETDKIKAVLAKAGVDISIYGDGLSTEQLEKITGSQSVATMVENQLKEYDVPATDENVSDAVSKIDQAKQLEDMSQETKAYLVKNDMEPTIANVYKATYSSSQMSAGNGNGSTKISDEEFEALKPQLKQILSDAGIEASEDNLNQCRWLIDNQIAVTPDNVLYANKLDAIIDNAGNTDTGFYVRSVAQAIATGKTAADATMSQDDLIFDKAAKAQEVLESATAEDVAQLEAENKSVTIENLAAAAKSRENADTDKNSGTVKETDNISYNAQAEQITAQRKLYEARLYMTFQANVSLMKKGISIDTEPIERMVDLLKEQENQYYSALFGQDEVTALDEKAAAYNNVTEIFEQMKFQPAYVLDLNSQESTVYEIYTAGKAMQQSFEKATAGYETLMTSPRADMGDSISKAFQNVDDILKDLDMETSDENRRAVRILAYNSTDITKENISHIKAVDEQVQRAFKEMSPAVTVEMIKKGISPLDMTMQELADTASQIKNEISDDRNEKYSEFLWKLEKNNEITQEERDSYIGIYRLISQVERSDGAVIGALVNQGADITMKNLLSAVRTKGKGQMDYKVDDDFAGVNSINGGSRIDDQIAAAYNTNCIKDVLDEISPEKMDFAKDDSWLDMTPEQLKQAIESAETDQNMSDEYAAEQLEEFREAVMSPENVYAFLEKYDAKTTASNLMAASRLIKNPSEAVEKLWQQGESGVIKGLLEETIERFAEAVKNPEELAKAQEELAETAEHVMDNMIVEDKSAGSIDIKQMKLLCSQFRIASDMAKQENYIVPVETADGVTGVNLRIVRGEDKKGMVDIFFQGRLSGKVAASFEAKANGVSGVIAVSDEQTRSLLADNIGLLADSINENGDEPVDIRVAYVPDISAEQFVTEYAAGSGIGNNNLENISMAQSGTGTVQTTRLYHIAEQLIVNVSDLLGRDSL